MTPSPVQLKYFQIWKALKPIKGWDYNDSKLVAKNGKRLSGYGAERHWFAIDSAVKFWDTNGFNPINRSTTNDHGDHVNPQHFYNSTGTKKDKFHWRRQNKYTY